jgi:WD40 repeat protein
MNSPTKPRRLLLLAALLVVPSSARSAEDTAQDAGELSPTPARLFARSNDYQAVAFSPDGKYMAVGGGMTASAGEVELFDVATRKSVWRQRESIGVASVSFSANSKSLAWSGLGDRLRAIDIESRKELFSVRVPGRAKRIRHSPDGKWLALVTEDGEAQLRDPATGKVVHRLAGENNEWRCLAFSPDSKFLVAGGGFYARPDTCAATVWDVDTRKQVVRLRGHKLPVLGVAFAPRGDRIATASADRTARIWDGKTFAMRAVLEGHTLQVQGLAFSPDGKTLATGGSDRSIRLWDAGGKELARLDGHPSVVADLAISPDGLSLLSGGWQRSLKLWDLKTRKESVALRKMEDTTGQPVPVAMAVTRDGKRVALGLDSGLVTLRDSTTGDILFTLKGHDDAVTTLDFSPDGKWLASAGTDATVRVWSTETGKEHKKFEGHESWVFAVRFSPDGKSLASGSYDKTVRVWDVAGKAAPRVLAGHRASVRAVAFSPDGKRLASGSSDKSIRVWGLDDPTVKEVLRGHEGTMRGLAFTADGTGLFSAGEDGLLKRWDIGSGKETKSVKATDVGIDGDQLFALALSPGGKVIATGNRRGNVRLWAAEDLAPLFTQYAHNGGVLTVAYRADGQQIFTLGEDRAVSRWDTRLAPVRLLTGHKGPVRIAVFSPDGKRVVSGGGWPDGDKTLKLWDVATGKMIREFEGIDGQIGSAGYSPDGKHAIAGLDGGKLLMWDVETGKRVRDFKGHKDGVQQITFSRDGARMLTASHDRTVRLWDTGKDEALQVFEGHTDWVRSAVFLPGEKQILSGGRDKTVRLWNVTGGKALKTIDIGDGVEGLAALSDGKRFLTGGGNPMLLCDIESGRVLRRYLGHAYGITAVALHRDDRFALTTSYDGSTRLWDVESGEETYRFGNHRDWVWSVVWAPDGEHFLTAGGGGSANGKYVPGTDHSIRLWRMPGRLMRGAVR